MIRLPTPAVVYSLLVLTACASDAFTNVPAGYVQCNNKWWKITVSSSGPTWLQNWTAAELRCAMDGSQLAILSDEDRHCAYVLGWYRYYRLCTWVGFNDAVAVTVEDNYLWLNGQHVHRNLLHSKPNRNIGHNCGCVHFDHPFLFYLDLMDCGSEQYYLCQFPAMEYKRCGGGFWKYYQFKVNAHDAESRCAVDGAKLARLPNDMNQKCFKQFTSIIGVKVMVWVSKENITGSQQCVTVISNTSTPTPLVSNCSDFYTFMCMKDINECMNGSHKCEDNTNCINTIGSYTCHCNKGYTANSTGVTRQCEDDNECKNGSHNCDINAHCINTMGSYTCRCKEGYTGNGTTGDCADTNVCRNGLHECDVNARCNNIEGWYTCQCYDGYTGNGTTSHCAELSKSTTPSNGGSLGAIIGAVVGVGLLVLLGIFFWQKKIRRKPMTSTNDTCIYENPIPINRTPQHSTHANHLTVLQLTENVAYQCFDKNKISTVTTSSKEMDNLYVEEPQADVGTSDQYEYDYVDIRDKQR